MSGVTNGYKKASFLKNIDIRFCHAAGLGLGNRPKNLMSERC